MKTFRFLAIAALTAAVVLAVGCGGGGSGGTVSSSCLRLLPSAAPASSNVVVRQGSGTQCSVLEVEFVLTDVTDVFAASFTMTYDPSFADFESVSLVGSHLGSDGATIDTPITTASGEVNVGLTRISDVGVDFNGTRTLAKVLLRRTRSSGSASAPLTVSDGKLLGSETPPLEKQNITWIGGTIELRD